MLTLVSDETFLSRQRVSTLLAGGKVWWVVAPWLGRDKGRDKRREATALPHLSNAERQDAQHPLVALEDGGIGRRGRFDAWPSRSSTRVKKATWVVVMEKTMEKVNELRGDIQLSSESGMSYYPSGLFLSRGREVLSFVCSMFITQFPFWLMSCSTLSSPPPSGFYCSFKWGQFGCLAEQAGSVWHQLPLPTSKSPAQF